QLVNRRWQMRELETGRIVHGRLIPNYPVPASQSLNDAEDEQEDTEETEMCQWICRKHGRLLRVTFPWAATRHEISLLLRIHGSVISVTSCSTEWFRLGALRPQRSLCETSSSSTASLRPRGRANRHQATCSRPSRISRSPFATTAP